MIPFLLLGALASSPDDSAVLARTRELLEQSQDTLGATDLLLGWAENHDVTPAVAQVLDRLFLPDSASSVPDSTPSDSLPAAPKPESVPPASWRVRLQAITSPSDECPFLSALDIARKAQLSPRALSYEIGVAAFGAALKTGGMASGQSYAALVGRWPKIDARLESWLGWDENSEVETGLAASCTWSARIGENRFLSGPFVRWSLRRANLLGFESQWTKPVFQGEWTLAGNAQFRQDPVDGIFPESSGWKIEDRRFQWDLAMRWMRSYRRIAFGPGVEVDWTNSLGDDQIVAADGLSRSTRSDLAVSAQGFLDWNLSRTILLQSKLEWVWVDSDPILGFDFSERTGGFRLALGTVVLF